MRHLPVVSLLIVSLVVPQAAAAQVTSILVVAAQQSRTATRHSVQMKRQTLRRASARAERQSKMRAQRKAASKRVRKKAQMAASLTRQFRKSKRASLQRRKLHNQLKAEFGLEFVTRSGRDILARRGEVLGINLDENSIAIVRRLGYRFVHRRRLATLNMNIFVMKLPESVNLETSLVDLRASDPKGQYELNSVFDPSGDTAPTSDTSLPATINSKPNSSITIGIIDTGVDADHASFDHILIDQKNFGRGSVSTARDHGTAVASILSRQGRPTLKIADVFSGEAGFSDVDGIVHALDWMASENVAVINMSLAGPDNFLLSLAIKSLIARGHLIVAAVGNEGPGGNPQFPAAYPQVIGVTAVSADGAIYDLANRGPSVDVAAYGVLVSAASLAGSDVYTGTSFAVPVVSAYLAPRLHSPDPDSARNAWDALKQQTRDLGEPGPDATFGYGFLILPDVAPSLDQRN